MRGALRHGLDAGLVGEERVGLLLGAPHIAGVVENTYARAVGSDCRPRVRDVGLVRVGGRVARGVTRNTAHEHGEERERRERDPGREERRRQQAPVAKTPDRLHDHYFLRSRRRPS
jgi:hypothetical protein